MKRRSNSVAQRASGPTPDVESVKHRIHQVALELFARYGVDGVSLQRIADEVGLHKSTLFHYYRGKTELAAEVFGEAVAKVVALLGPLADDQPPQLETLLCVVDSLCDHFADEPQAARLILSIISAPADSDLRMPDEDRGTGAVVVQFYTLVFGWLERAKHCGVIADDVSLRQTLSNLMGLLLFYPAVAHDLDEVAGPEPFSSKARANRKRELRRMLSALAG